MTFLDLVWYFPLAIAAALVVGASGRDRPKEVVRGAVHAFWTLLLVVGGVGLTIRLLVVLLV
jgi:hypothetical protein